MLGTGELMAMLGILLLVVMTGVWAWTLFDCATNEPRQGNDRSVWMLVILLAPFVGALIYLIVRRRRRDETFGR